MSSSSTTQFGQNQWLVDEMYQRFKEDPSSVDASWHEFLTDYDPDAPAGDESPSAPNGSAASGNGAAKNPAPKPETPKAAATEAKTAKAAPQASAPKAEAPAAPKPAAEKPAPTAKPATSKAAGAAPSAPAAKPAAAPATEASSKVLRGAAAAVAKNMSASLQIPTATSVRAIPAKLMVDNRLVINNHLARTRGGKISFTHLLGYAIVQAVKAFPNMNRHFAEVDGKPNAVTPASTNLGLAIDLPGKDGNRSLVVAAIKNTNEHSFTQFYNAYEDIVRRARDGKLTGDDF